MKSVLWLGIVLIVVGIAGGFVPQIIGTIRTGVPASGIPLLQTSGFVVAAIGAVIIGVAIGRRAKEKRQAREAASDVTSRRG